MPAYIHQISTAVPENFYTQEFAREFMKEHVAERDAHKRMLHRIYAMSAIDKRHSVITDFEDGAESGIYFDRSANRFLSPSTGKRNELYTREARRLFTTTARKTLVDSGFSSDQVTHVITVSCTGFFAPGPDYFIVRELGLSPAVRRYHIGFMGCYAAFNAIKMAESVCIENPEAVVLVVCLELCTIHLQNRSDTDAMISASVFADGAAGMVISSRPVEKNRPALEISKLETTLTPQGEQDMAWTIGDSGFDMILSTYVPDIIEANLDDLLRPLLKPGAGTDAFSYWAVHPGGRAILDKVEQSLKLDKRQIAPSRQVLRDYGNMSSATILFVLEQILYHGESRDKPFVAMAFGPGLTVETGIFDFVNRKNGINLSETHHAALPA
jgi:predicted naringenin-chalcone synthase